MFLTSCIHSTPHTQGSDWDYLLPGGAESRPNTSVSFLTPPLCSQPSLLPAPKHTSWCDALLAGCSRGCAADIPHSPSITADAFLPPVSANQDASCSITLQSHLRRQGRCARGAPRGDPADQRSSFAHHCPALTRGRFKDTTRADISQGCPQTPAKIRSQSALLRKPASPCHLGVPEASCLQFLTQLAARNLSHPVFLRPTFPIRALLLPWEGVVRGSHLRERSGQHVPSTLCARPPVPSQTFGAALTYQHCSFPRNHTISPRFQGVVCFSFPR